MINLSLKSLLDAINKYAKNKFVNDVIWTTIATIIVGSSALILQTFVGSSFKASGLGIYSQVIAIYLILTAIGNFGIEISTLKHTAEFSDNYFKLCQLYSSSQVLVVLVSSILISVFAFILFSFPFIFSSSEVAEGIKYVLPGVFFFGLNKNSNSFILGLRQLKLYSAIRAVRWILIMLLTLCVVFLKLNFNYLLFSYSVVEFLLFLFFLFKIFKYTKIVTDKKWYRIHFNYGVTNVVGSIVAAFSENLIVLISGYYLTKSETGVIAFMLTFASIIFVLSSSIQINFSPIFANKWANKDFFGIHDYLKKLFRFTTITAAPLFLISILFYVFYTNLFMENEFHNTGIKFTIIAIGAIFTYILSWPIAMLSMAGKIKENLVRNILISGSNVFLSFILIVNFGIFGGLLSYTLVSFFSVVISYYIINQSININLVTAVKKCWL